MFCRSCAFSSLAWNLATAEDNLKELLILPVLPPVHGRRGEVNSHFGWWLIGKPV
jgi:hypothetical protein